MSDKNTATKAASSTSKRSSNASSQTPQNLLERALSANFYTDIYNDRSFNQVVAEINEAKAQTVNQFVLSMKNFNYKDDSLIDPTALNTITQPNCLIFRNCIRQTQNIIDGFLRSSDATEAMTSALKDLRRFMTYQFTFLNSEFEADLKSVLCEEANNYKAYVEKVNRLEKENERLTEDLDRVDTLNADLMRRLTLAMEKQSQARKCEEESIKAIMKLKELICIEKIKRDKMEFNAQLAYSRCEKKCELLTAKFEHELIFKHDLLVEKDKKIKALEEEQLEGKLVSKI